jgi:hypothetical protein
MTAKNIYLQIKVLIIGLEYMAWIPQVFAHWRHNQFKS